jgi:hypothetical protein
MTNISNPFYTVKISDQYIELSNVYLKNNLITLKTPTFDNEIIKKLEKVLKKQLIFNSPQKVKFLNFVKQRLDTLKPKILSKYQVSLYVQSMLQITSIVFMDTTQRRTELHTIWESNHCINTLLVLKVYTSEVDIYLEKIINSKKYKFIIPIYMNENNDNFKIGPYINEFHFINKNFYWNDLNNISISSTYEQVLSGNELLQNNIVDSLLDYSTGYFELFTPLYEKQIFIKDMKIYVSNVLSII